MCGAGERGRQRAAHEQRLIGSRQRLGQRHGRARTADLAQGMRGRAPHVRIGIVEHRHELDRGGGIADLTERLSERPAHAWIRVFDLFAQSGRGRLAADPAQRRGGPGALRRLALGQRIGQRVKHAGRILGGQRLRRLPADKRLGIGQRFDQHGDGFGAALRIPAQGVCPFPALPGRRRAQRGQRTLLVHACRGLAASFEQLHLSPIPPPGAFHRGPEMLPIQP